MTYMWWAVFFLLLIILLALAVRRIFVVVTVHGRSMEPTYRDGDRVLVRRTRNPKVGQIAVIEHPHACGTWCDSRRPPLSGGELVSSREWLLKRVVAAPGDPVPLDRVPRLADFLDDRVPLDKTVVLGDNAEVSYDSRAMGFIPTERVLGVVLRRLNTTAPTSL